MPPRALAATLVLVPIPAVAGPSILVWPADEASSASAAEVRDVLADRGGLAPVEDGPIRARIAEGSRVDPLVFVSEAGRVAESAIAAIEGSPEGAVEMTRGPEREYLADLATEAGVRGLRALALVRVRAHTAARDREAAAREALFAVGLDPAGEIDVAALPREVRPIVEAAIRDRAGLPRVSLSVESAPDGARVLVDGRPAGRTPVEATVTPGLHVVRVDRPGFGAAARIVDVGVGGARVPSTALRPVLGEPLLEQIATLSAAGDLALDDADIVALLAAAGQSRYVGIVRRTGAGIDVTIHETSARRSPGVASGRTAAGVAEEIERLTLGAPVRPRGAPEPPPPPPPRTHFYEKWWFWAGVGVVAVAGGVTIVVFSQEAPQGVVRWGD